MSGLTAGLWAGSALFTATLGYVAGRMGAASAVRADAAASAEARERQLQAATKPIDLGVLPAAGPDEKPAGPRHAAGPSADVWVDTSTDVAVRNGQRRIALEWRTEPREMW